MKSCLHCASTRRLMGLWCLPCIIDACCSRHRFCIHRDRVAGTARRGPL